MVLNTERAVNNYRFERKFGAPELTVHEVEDLIKKHPAMFSEIFSQRFVNNIYFDSISMKNYYDSVYGSSYRMKIRIRWYGALFGEVSNPILELKIRDGLVGSKLSFQLVPFILDNKFGVKTIKNILSESKIPDDIKYRFNYLFPTLLNRYRRKYYQSSDRNFRITLDNDLSFYRIDMLHNGFINNNTDKQNVVLELKYDRLLDSVSERITNSFPFRLVRSSKYVIGIEKVSV